MSTWGGRREGAGRPPGSISKTAAELRTLAQEFGPSAIQRLALMAGLLPDQPGADSQAVQVAALRELLDRGYGRATQHVGGDGDASPLQIEFRWADELPAAVPAPAAAAAIPAEPSDDAEVSVIWAAE